MVIFMDTSSLVKLYYNENDSIELLGQVTEESATIFLSELSKLEFVSALYKKVRTGEISFEIGRNIINFFTNDFKNFNWVYLDDQIITGAINLLEKYMNKNLLTLDSLQLASALKVKNDAEVFITHDKLLKELFEIEGLNTNFV